MGQLGVHLVGVRLIEVEDLLAGFAVEMAVGKDVGVERFEIGETLLLGDSEHLLFDVGHLLQGPEHAVLRGGVGGGLDFDGVSIARITIG